MQMPIGSRSTVELDALHSMSQMSNLATTPTSAASMHSLTVSISRTMLCVGWLKLCAVLTRDDWIWRQKRLDSSQCLSVFQQPTRMIMPP